MRSLLGAPRYIRASVMRVRAVWLTIRRRKAPVPVLVTEDVFTHPFIH